MRLVRLLFTLLLLLLPAARLSAQWSGSVDASGGFGAMESIRGELLEDEGYPKSIYHGLGQTTVKVNYKSPTFQWTSLLEGKLEKKSTDNYHLSALVSDKNDLVNGYDLKAVIKINEEIPVKAQHRSDIVWRPVPGQRFTFWTKYNLDFKTSDNYTYKGSWKAHKESLSQESPVTWDNTASGGISTVHELGRPRRVLSTEFSIEMNDKQQTTVWSTIGVQPGEGEEEEAWLTCYRLTPHSRASTYKGTVHYRDSLLNGKVRLMVNPGLRYIGNMSRHENSGATLDQESSSIENPVWRDSTGIREWFHFSSIDFQPYLVADFSWKKIRVHVDYALSFYGRKLTDSTHTQTFKWQSPMLLGDGRVEWLISPRHKLTLSNKITVKHPTYLQVCWFDRSGGYIEQLYRGSEALRSTRTSLGKLAYDFNYRRFVASTSVSYSWRSDEIEQTWFREEIDHRHYKVFTWLNGADSRIQNVTQKLGWRGKMITANVGVDYNYTVRTWRDKDKVKKTTDWRLTADIAAHLQKGWTLSTDIKYQSAVATFFALFKQYCVLNAKVQKDFKHFSIYLQGRDLLDKPVESEYISEDETEYWTESVLHNRRLVLLGFNWKF